MEYTRHWEIGPEKGGPFMGMLRRLRRSPVGGMALGGAVLSAAILGLAGGVLLGQDPLSDDNNATVSGDNCTFLADRGRFLQHDFRARKAIQERVQAFDNIRAMMPAGPLSGAVSI